ncbi:hypothetical protein T440DRAFT_508002 [Plenodomus tracheiphilus IPT5]|uniref:Heterokaryon incompatibility domain-containing protein n=1 Tax=Plenodomus tracheiphilus IPT5 TaxID=1408161 RepID=A0A6A7B848_9PLEO|nr:hypothetical protein T440DRAFT_508002 [Plenodomus tracheiphilus IPT5]
MVLGSITSQTLSWKPTFFFKLKKPAIQYQPLPENHIRLLRVYPSCKGVVICCSLEVVNLLDYEDITGKSSIPNLETYDAVSYVWGSSKGTHRIMCNGVPVYITRNAKDVIERLRHDKESRTLWLDFLCIDQSNHFERAEQVKLMGLVYWKARHVHIWLGRDRINFKDHGAALAVERMQELGQLYRKISSPDSHEYNLDLFDEQTALPMQRPPKKQEYKWHALRQLFKRPWFQRVWVVQELGLSRDATFYCGDTSFTRNELDDFTALLKTRGSALSQHHNIWLRNLELADQYRSSTRGNLRLEFGSDPSLAESFLDILGKARGLKCTDPRDSVYAFLGHPAAYKQHLADDAPYMWYPRNYYDGKRTIIHPEYREETTFFDVYRSIATTYIGSVGFGLDILLHVAHDKRTIAADFPSWIPRWDLAASLPHPFEGGRVNYSASGKLTQPTLNMVYTAHEANKPRLKLEAVHLDSVLCTHKPKTTDMLVSLITGAFKCNRPRTLHATPLDPTTLAITLTAGLSTGRDLLLNRADADVDQHYSRFCAYLGLDTETLTHLGNNTRHPTEREPQYYSLDVHRAASNRVLICTEDGRLGLGPQITRKGDQSWIIIGANMPFMLRELPDGTFRILGPMYLHGVMRGELVENLSQDDVRSIEIC